MELITQACLSEVLLGKDMMSAQLKLHRDEEGKKLTISDIKDILAENGVKAGIVEDAITKMVAHEIYDVFVEVAKGKAAVRGKDGYFIYHFEEVESSNAPQILESGEVEYVHTNAYTMVEEGDLLAEYIPATNGEFGYTIDSKMIKPEKGTDLSPLRGKGFRIDNGKYYALLHGKLERNDMGMQITRLLEVKQNVDIAYGHVDFDGDVNIWGDVYPGMTVKASGNIEIRGHVGSCHIEAGKNITILRGVQGKLAGKLVAGGDITCKFFESAIASARGNIIARSILNSKLEAEGMIQVSGKDSVILGGTVHAVQGMDIVDAGSDAEIPTVLSAGVPLKTVQRGSELEGLVKKVQDEISLLDKAAGVMQRMMQTKVTKETADRRMKIIQAKVIKSTELRQYVSEKDRIDTLIANGRGAAITVQNTAYPGCVIEIAGMRRMLKERVWHSRFVIENGEIDTVLLY